MTARTFEQPARRPLMQRVVTDALYRRGRFEPAKLAAIAGMVILAWWCVAFADKLTTDWMTGCTFISLLIAPTFVHKLMAGKAGK